QPCGRLFLVPEDAAQPTAEPVELPALPARYNVSSDPQLVAAAQATAKDQDDLLHCRDEGEFLVSYPTAAGWVGLTKDLLTDFCGTGHDARLVLPRAAAALLAAMAPELVVLPRARNGDAVHTRPATAQHPPAV